jgi:hypothetical protein
LAFTNGASPTPSRQSRRSGRSSRNAPPRTRSRVVVLLSKFFALSSRAIAAACAARSGRFSRASLGELRRRGVKSRHAWMLGSPAAHPVSG